MLRYTVRLLLLTAIGALGMLPYSFEIGGRCRVVPQHTVAVRAQLPDEIERIFVTEGHQVSRNQVIATLTGREERAALAEAQAEVAYAKANVKLAETGARDEDLAKAAEQITMWKSQLNFWEIEHKRQQDLMRDNATPVSSVDRALNSRNTATAMLTRAKEDENKLKTGTREEALAAAKAKLAKAEATLRLQEDLQPLREIRSPIDGELLTPGVHLREGQAVSPGDVIAVVRDGSPVTFEVLADEAASENVKAGMHVKLRLWGNYGALITGTVVEVSKVARRESEIDAELYRTDRESQSQIARLPETGERFVRLMVKPDTQEDWLLPGMTGEARVVIHDDLFWNAMWRPVKRFVLVEVWSWLP